MSRQLNLSSFFKPLNCQKLVENNTQRKTPPPSVPSPSFQEIEKKFKKKDILQDDEKTIKNDKNGIIQKKQKQNQIDKEKLNEDQDYVESNEEKQNSSISSPLIEENQDLSLSRFLAPTKENEQTVKETGLLTQHSHLTPEALSRASQPILQSDSGSKKTKKILSPKPQSLRAPQKVFFYPPKAGEKLTPLEQQVLYIHTQINHGFRETSLQSTSFYGTDSPLPNAGIQKLPPPLFRTSSYVSQTAPSSSTKSSRSQPYPLFCPPHIVLAIECGYKYRFFGVDSFIAHNILGIWCGVSRHMLTSSIPTFRLYYHIRRLISAGYKVGVVAQTESTFIKKATKETKNTIFERKLQSVYSKGTAFGSGFSEMEKKMDDYEMSQDEMNEKDDDEKENENENASETKTTENDDAKDGSDSRQANDDAQDKKEAERFKRYHETYRSQNDNGMIVALVEDWKGRPGGAAGLFTKDEPKSIVNERKLKLDDEEDEGVQENAPLSLTIGMVALDLASLTIYYDVFEDSFIRGELETRLLHLFPSEVLLPSRQTTEETMKALEVMGRCERGADCDFVFDNEENDKKGKEEEQDDDDDDDDDEADDDDENLFSKSSKNTKSKAKRKQTSCSFDEKSFKNPPFPAYRIEELPQDVFTKKAVISQLQLALSQGEESNKSTEETKSKEIECKNEKEIQKMMSLDPTIAAACGALLFYLQQFQISPADPVPTFQSLSEQSFTFGSFTVSPLFKRKKELYLPSNTIRNLELLRPSTLSVPTNVASFASLQMDTSIRKRTQPSSSQSQAAIRSVSQLNVDNFEGEKEESDDALLIPSQIRSISERPLEKSEKDSKRKERKRNDGDVGSLFWLINRTSTTFGARLLRQWLLRPLGTIDEIRERQDAVEELITATVSDSQSISSFGSFFSSLLLSLPDLEKMSVSAHFGRIRPREWVKGLSAVQAFVEDVERWRRGRRAELMATEGSVQMSQEPFDAELVGTQNSRTEYFSSSLLNTLLNALPSLDLVSLISKHLSSISFEAADKNDFSDLFLPTFNETIDKLRETRERIKKEFDDYLDEASELTTVRPISYGKWMGFDYYICVPTQYIKQMPDTFTLQSSTKQIARFTTAAIEAKRDAMAEIDERIEIEGRKEWRYCLERDESVKTILSMISRIITATASLDCLLSLSSVALTSGASSFEGGENGYVRPQFVEFEEIGGALVEIVDGKHPVLDCLNPSQPCIPNSVLLSSSPNLPSDEMEDDSLTQSPPSSLIVTGPNAGGKSVFVKQIGLLVLLAHMGCYVPAKKMRLTPFDGVYTRMGSSESDFDSNSDDVKNSHLMFSGIVDSGRGKRRGAGMRVKLRSTFMTEMEETSFILDNATDRSLVILDELGRGTATHDGTAIAYASLHHILTSLRSICLFVTHFPVIYRLLQNDGLGNESTALALLKANNEKKTSDSENNAKEQTTHCSVDCCHMDYIQDSEDPTKIVFLYRAVPGIADRSFGLNVARLAGISDNIVKRAAEKSFEFEQLMEAQRKSGEG